MNEKEFTEFKLKFILIALKIRLNNKEQFGNPPLIKKETAEFLYFQGH